MTLSLIAAMSENRVIGRGQKLPWNLPEDLKRFKRITLGHPVIMGRKTLDSIGQPLSGRSNIVITRDLGFSFAGVTTVNSLADALAPFKNSVDEVFVIGGGEIFRLAMDICDRLYLTEVHKHIEGDVYFPSINQNSFTEISRERHEGPVPYSFVDLVRKN